MTDRMPAVSLSAVPGKVHRVLDVIGEVESRGFTGIFSPSFGDQFGLCQAVAERSSSLIFGTSIANIYTRQPSDFAVTAAFLHELSGGRFRFGIGVSHAPMHQRLGITPGPPLADARSFVEELRATPRVGELPPIVLAAMRDKMVALSAEVGDGLVYANAARSAVPGSLERMRASTSVERDLFLGCMIPTCVSDDREAAAAVNRKTLTGYVALPNYRNYWRDNGYHDEMEAVRVALEAGDRDAVLAAMTDEWLADVTLFGSADEVRAGVEAWFDAGVTTPILVPSSTSGGQLVALGEIFALYD